MQTAKHAIKLSKGIIELYISMYRKKFGAAIRYFLKPILKEKKNKSQPSFLKSVHLCTKRIGKLVSLENKNMKE
jgi:hypothetical protein